MNIKKFLVVFLVLSTLVSCATTLATRRIKPFYDGVDPQAAPYVKEWLDLAQQKGIKFTGTVTVGLRPLEAGRIIGVCNYGFGFNEIDLDTNYWSRSTNLSRMSLVYHELGHCYCDRDHDFGGKKYPTTDIEQTREIFEIVIQKKQLPGYYDDLCPKSLMYPTSISDECVKTHYNEYVDEVFQNCNPW